VSRCLSVQVAGNLAARRGRGESQRSAARGDAAETSHPEGRGGSRAEGGGGEGGRCGRGDSEKRSGNRRATAKTGCRQADQSERAGSQGESRGSFATLALCSFKKSIIVILARFFVSGEGHTGRERERSRGCGPAGELTKDCSSLGLAAA